VAETTPKPPLGGGFGHPLGSMGVVEPPFGTLRPPQVSFFLEKKNVFLDFFFKKNNN
jgi:hypothetical protein